MIVNEVILSEKPSCCHEVHRYPQIIYKVNMGLPLLWSLKPIWRNLDGVCCASIPRETLERSKQKGEK